MSQAAVDFAEQQDVLEHKTLNQLNALEDEVEEETLETYRKRRLEELRKAKERNIFGTVVHVGKADYVTEVTDCSKQSKDRCVVLLLYTEAKPVCQLLVRALKVLASRHGYVKFCKAIGSDVIPDFPESRVPTVLVYKNGHCIHQFLGGSLWGGNTTTPEIVEWVLWKHDILDSATVEEDPRTTSQHSSQHYRGNKGHIMYSLDEDKRTNTADDEDDEEFTRNADKRGYSSLAMERALRLK